MMNLSTLKNLFLTTVFMLFGCLAIQAQVFIYPTKGLNIEIKLDEAGTLPGRIEHIKDDISELKIIGEINGTDLDVIREMAGGINQIGHHTDGILSVLDLSEARIVKGGHYVILGSHYSTSKDKIGESVFYACSSLTSITLPPLVTEIGNSAFYDCRGLTSLILPSGVTKIGNSAFSGCSGLTSLTLPSGVTEIGNSAFSGCSGLTSLTLPSGVTEIGNSAFSGCSGLTSLTLPSGVTEIGNSAFSGCSGLTGLTLPSSVTEIGNSAFSGCSGLTSLTLPSGVTRIGSSAFKNCGLKEVGIYINGDLETYLAKGHPNIDVECGIKYYLNDKEIKNVMIPSSVTSLGCYAFQNSCLTSISLPSSLAFVGDGAFKNCSSLASITFSSGLVSIGSSVFSGCSGLTSLILPFGLNSIGSYAFAECRNLTRITLPASLSSIADYAFENCSNIASLTIPFGVTKIGDYAFSDCSRLTSLTIPSSVKSLGDYAFQKCSSLQSIYVSWSIPISVGKTFYAVDKSKCTLYVPQGTEHDYLLADVWGDFWNIIEYNPTGIDKVTTSTDAKELSRYSVNGQRLSAPAKGLNIVKYSDGSVKKIVVQ